MALKAMDTEDMDKEFMVLEAMATADIVMGDIALTIIHTVGTLEGTVHNTQPHHILITLMVDIMPVGMVLSTHSLLGIHRAILNCMVDITVLGVQVKLVDIAYRICLSYTDYKHLHHLLHQQVRSKDV